MKTYTPYQAKYFAEQILLKRSQSSIDGLASAMSSVKVDLNPHQVDAALFALKSPLSQGALLADEVGLGKTIEAGLVLAQCWSERKRHILLIVPASLRTQWRTELDEKFFIKSKILESANFNKDKKEGISNPFNVRNEAVICSYNFASHKESEITAIPWDLVIIDEAHRLRNVYKPDNVMGRRLKRVLTGKRKLLLTATPLQNNLMELFGLVSIIGDRVFGDARTFRETYVTAVNEETRNYNLKQRLKQFCKRTLRKQVIEYVSYTNRIPIVREYSPTQDEETLYSNISEYLRSERLYALPQGQRTLITSVNKLVYLGFDTEENLIMSVVTEDGTEIDEAMMNSILELPAISIDECVPEVMELEKRREDSIAAQLQYIEKENKKYYLDECEKLDAYSEDLKEGLEREHKELRKLITEKRKLLRLSKDTEPLDVLVGIKDTINKLEEKRKNMQREIYDRQDEIELENECLQEEIRARLNGTSRTEHVMTVSFEIV
jgi:hypothetical protein